MLSIYVNKWHQWNKPAAYRLSAARSLEITYKFVFLLCRVDINTILYQIYVHFYRYLSHFPFNSHSNEKMFASCVASL